MDDVAYMVRCKTQAACQRELDRICALLGATPTMTPRCLTDGRWMARAVPPPAAQPPADNDQGPAGS